MDAPDSYEPPSLKGKDRFEGEQMRTPVYKPKQGSENWKTSRPPPPPAHDEGSTGIDQLNNQQIKSF